MTRFLSVFQSIITIPVTCFPLSWCMMSIWRCWVLTDVHICTVQSKLSQSVRNPSPMNGNNHEGYDSQPSRANDSKIVNAKPYNAIPKPQTPDPTSQTASYPGQNGCEDDDCYAIQGQKHPCCLCTRAKDDRCSCARDPNPLCVCRSDKTNLTLNPWCICSNYDRPLCGSPLCECTCAQVKIMIFFTWFDPCEFRKLRPHADAWDWARLKEHFLWQKRLQVFQCCSWNCRHPGRSGNCTRLDTRCKS